MVHEIVRKGFVCSERSLIDQVPRGFGDDEEGERDRTGEREREAGGGRRRKTPAICVRHQHECQERVRESKPAAKRQEGEEREDRVVRAPVRDRESPRCISTVV